MKFKSAILFLFISISGFAQYVPVSPDDHLMLFLNELETEHIIDNLNQSSFEWSEKSIYNILEQAEYNARDLNQRQKQELGFYVRYFKLYNEANRWYEHDVDIARFENFSLGINPPGLYIRNENGGFSLTPLAGTMFTLNSVDKNLQYHYGLKTSGNIGPVGYYFSYRRNGNSQYTYEPYIQEHFPALGFSYASRNEIKAGISFSNNFLTTAFSFDNPKLMPVAKEISVLNTYTPAFPSILITTSPLPWLSYQFRTGYINTSFDNTQISNYFSGTNLITSFATNQLIINPYKSIELALGQSAFLKNNGFKSTYLIPVNFYVSNDPKQNTFLFYRINIASVRHLNFSFSHIIDAFSMERMQSDYDKNVHALYFDISLSNWPAPNLNIHGFYNVQSPLFLDHKTSPLYNLWLSTNRYSVDNRRFYGLEFVMNPTFNLMIQAGYQREAWGDSYTYSNPYPYDFEILSPVKRKTDIFSFEFTLKSGYSSSLFAGIHFINHKGDDPSFRVVDYNENVDFFFRTGFIIGL
ncbi:hypothetical protein ACE1ET_11810 [Saccharicrinis sp. FJH62]|uniref:hypothetical protein n=1 Tax=Saccharicrinis sp. FJH62 TaxID=3344657 RepID=UPI0035D4C354